MALLLLLLGFVDWDRQRQVRARLTAEIAAASSKATLRYQDKLAEKTQEFHDILNTERQENAKANDLRLAEINKLRLTADRLARVDPLSFGDDYHVRLARIMCRIEAATDHSAVETCDHAPAEAYLTDIAFTLTVTQDNAEIWREQCEDGHKDFCGWSLTGMTPQASLTLLTWLESVDAYAREQGDHINMLHDMVGYLGEKHEVGW